MIVKIHKAQGRVVAAVCDSNLIGNVIEEGNKQLDLSSNFYKGDEVDERKLFEALKCADILNFVGEGSVGFAIKKGFIDAKKVIRIKGVPHAQSVAANG